MSPSLMSYAFSRRRVPLSRNHKIPPVAAIEYNDSVGSWTGRSLSASSNAERGKSELHRAVCRITSGRAGSSPFDGKCHRKYTAPHTEQDQIGRKPGLRFGHVPARCVKPSGRSLEPCSDAWPRGMTVPPEQSGGQNSAYRSGCQEVTFSEGIELGLSATNNTPM